MISFVFSSLIIYEFENISLTFNNHDIPKWFQYKNWFSETLLCTELRMSISSHKSKYLVNSRPETLLILVKHPINKQRIFNKYWPCCITLRNATLTLKITNTANFTLKKGNLPFEKGIFPNNDLSFSANQYSWKDIYGQSRSQGLSSSLPWSARHRGQTSEHARDLARGSRGS